MGIAPQYIFKTVLHSHFYVVLLSQKFLNKILKAHSASFCSSYAHLVQLRCQGMCSP